MKAFLLLMLTIIMLSGCQFVPKFSDEELVAFADSCREENGHWFEGIHECHFFLSEEKMAPFYDFCLEEKGNGFESFHECLVYLPNKQWCDERGGYYSQPQGCGTLKKYSAGQCTSDIKIACGFDYPYWDGWMLIR